MRGRYSFNRPSSAYQDNVTWQEFYSVSGECTPREDEDLSGNDTPSRSVQGAFNFLKTCPYLATWRVEWKFVLELLYEKLDQWLKQLTASQHMSNLWVDKEDYEWLTPYHDNISTNKEDFFRAFPQYHLSDSALVWLALSQLEQLMSTIQEEFDASLDQDKNVNSMIEEVRKTASEVDSDILVFKRTIHDYTISIQVFDMAVIEASAHGLFKRSEDDIEPSWQETLDLQKQLDAQTFNKPRHIALALLAIRLSIPVTGSSKDDVREALHQKLSASLYDSGVFAQSIVENEPEPMRSWSASTYEALSIYLGSRFD
ncbi:MAG: hypothetical protein Q9167_004765 [Letrouitia subvulpina]